MSKLKEDSGAIAPLFAIILGAGLLLGLLAVVVDGGQAQLEKQSVQHAADAVAEAIGQHCANEYTAGDCLTDSFALRNQSSGQLVFGTVAAANSDFLQTLANPKGGSVSVTTTCGESSASPTLALCAATNLPGCITTPTQSSATPNWLRVGTASAKNAIFTGNTTINYQACAQVVWGKANGIPILPVGTQLPLMIGLCDVRLGAPFVQSPLLGNNPSRAGCPTFRDRDGVAFNANAHGWLQFALGPATQPAASACWTIQASGCTPVTLPTGPTDAARISNLAVAANANLNRVSLLPVFIYSAVGSPTVVSFVPYYLTGLRFFSNFGGVGCGLGAQLCISGSFKTRTLEPYGQASSLGISALSSVPNLGLQVLRKVP